MSKHIMINGSSAGYVLADSVDMDKLRRKVKRALELGAVIEVPVVLADHGGEPVTLLVNGPAVASVAVVEL